MEAKMDANLKEYVAEMRAWLKEMLCWEAMMEAMDLEANAEEI
jgi:hypothetical protein